MSLFWPGIISVSVILVVLFEMMASRKESAVRNILSLKEDSQEKSARYIPKMLFYTALGALSIAFWLYASHVKWSAPKNSVAIVFDTESRTKDESSFGQQKGVLQELLQGFPEIPLSLYQFSDGSLSCFVPPTIDRVYFSLQADGMQPSLGGAPSLRALQSQVFKKEANTLPWVIVISSHGVPEGVANLDGVSLIVPHLPDVMIRSFDRGSGKRETSFNTLTTRITSRIIRSEEVNTFDWFEKTLVVLSLAVALFASIQWRRRAPPLFWLSVLCLHACLGASSENAQVRQYIDLVDEKEYNAASQHLQELLPSIVDPRARERIFYDLALTSYLHGDEKETLSWLKSGQVGEKDVHLASHSKTLSVLAISRLVLENDTSADWRGELSKLLEKPLELPRSVVAEASLALLLPPCFSQDEMKTFLFYVQSLECQYPVSLYEKNSFRSLILNTEREVEKRLSELFPQGITAFKTLAEMALEDPFLLYRYLLWYTVSKQPNEEEALQYLLEEALQTVTEKMYFPSLKPLLDEKMEDILLLLEDKVSVPKEDNPATLSAAWYVTAHLRGFFNGEEKPKVEAVTLFVGSELEQNPPLLIQKMLVKALISRLHCPKSWYKEASPLTTFFWNVFLSWETKDTVAALDWLVNKVSHDRFLWEPYLEMLFVEEKSFGLTLDKDFTAYDPVLLGRLVSIEKSPPSTQEEGTHYVARLMVLYYDCLKKTSSETLSNTIGVIMGEQPKMGTSLLHLPVFKDDYTKRVNFENLIDEWTKRSYSVGELVKTSDRERVRKCYAVLVQIHQLLDEKEPLSEEAIVSAPALPEEKHFEIREEEAVRLYQEMDRMDRALYGE